MNAWRTLFVLILAVGYSAGLKVGAFNIQVFGRAKMSKPHVVDSLKLVYNIEIRDATQTAIYDLLNQVNDDCGNCFQMDLGPRLGRTSSKEQYAYFYKSSVRRETSYTYSDPSDVFERPPMVVRFRANGCTFGYIGIHVKPDDAVNEIDALVDVYEDMQNRWGIDDAVLGGDFNAACSYVRPGDWSRIRLRTQSRFQWVITDSMDTTLARSSCAYDRLVLVGDCIRSLYRGRRVHRFDLEQGLSNEEAKEVSDHYPVEMTI